MATDMATKPTREEIKTKVSFWLDDSGFRWDLVTAANNKDWARFNELIEKQKEHLLRDCVGY